MAYREVVQLLAYAKQHSFPAALTLSRSPLAPKHRTPPCPTEQSTEWRPDERHHEHAHRAIHKTDKIVVKPQSDKIR